VSNYPCKCCLLVTVCTKNCETYSTTIHNHYNWDKWCFINELKLNCPLCYGNLIKNEDDYVYCSVCNYVNRQYKVDTENNIFIAGYRNKFVNIKKGEAS